MEKKYLFISNGNKPTKEEYYSEEPITIGNVRGPSIEAALKLGYEVFVGINRAFPEKINNTNNYDIKFYNQNIYRNIFDIKNNYKAYKNLKDIIKKEKIDVIHCNTPIGGFLGRLMGYKLGVSKIIYTAHGFHFYKGAPLFKRLIFKNIERWLARYTDVIITMNHEDFKAAKNFRLKEKGKVYYVPGVGVNTQEYIVDNINVNSYKESLNIPINSTVVVSMGDLIKRKNYETSIKAIAKTNNKNIHYLICGKGPELEELEKLAIKLGIEKQISFLGFRNDIKEILAVSDIFLFTTYQEGMPRSMMEAMSAGLPVVASRIRGNVDLIEDNKGGYLIDPNDSASFAEALNKLVVNKKLREKMKNNNLEIIKEFDIENINKMMKKIYRENL